MTSDRLLSILLYRTRGPVPAIERAERFEASALGLGAQLCTDPPVPPADSG
ncbi:hypothetical protein ACIA8E_01005 [Streptomyces sp. NPDC051664]|uniref:hypothetical protein n=1 Tax=Streptomyces sp. NPDC051664 TaxID=3365668 RepID=UPI0037B2C2A3